MRRLRAALLMLLAASAGTAARAQDDGVLSGTLRDISARGSILLGYRDSAIPFSFQNRAKQPVGFSIDLCREIADDVAAALHRDLLEPDAPEWRQGIRVKFVPVSAENRFQQVVSGQADLECGSTTATAARAKQVAFSPVFFLSGTKLLVRADSGMASYQALAGRTVAVSAGTTNLQALTSIANRVSPPIAILQTPSVADGLEKVASAQADALASDDVLLYGLLATRPDGKRFRVIGDFLSFEPYAIMLRRDDPQFTELVQRSFERMAREGTLRSLYRRWLTKPLPNGENLNLPMSAQLAEMYRALGEPD